MLRKRESELLREAEELKQNYFQQDRLYSLACSDAKNLYFRIENLKTEVQKLEQEHEKLQHERNELDAARQKLQEQRQAKDAEICAVQREIADLLTVQLIACENGTIEAVDAPDFKVDDTGFEKLYAGFMEDPAYENLRAKDIRLLARVMCAIYNTKQNIKVLFDSEELQKFFDSLLAPVKLEAVS